MDYARKVSSHYSHCHLVDAIRKGLAQQGITPENASIDDLGPVDEFHIGGRAATSHFLQKLGMGAGQRWLDIGCGLGGAARYAAHTYGVHVAGIDITEDYVQAGQVMCDWVGLAERVELHLASALSLPFADAAFDGAYMMHVGMNIEDKTALFGGVARVLRPGAQFAIYDIMKTNDEALTFPVPWASSPDTSWLASPQDYRRMLEAVGFRVTDEANRREFALAFFEKMKEANEAGGGPPPLGLHVLMQKTTAEKVPNMIANMMAGRIAPFEMIGIGT